MGLVNGKDVIVQIFDSEANEYKPIACGRGISFEIQRDMIETTVTNSGEFRTYVPGPGTVTATIDGLVFISGVVTSKYDLGRLYDHILDGIDVNIKYYETDVTNNNWLQKEIGGYIETISETASFDNVSTFSITIKVVGKPTITYGEV